MNDSIKRWAILMGLLAVTVWLVFNAPQAEKLSESEVVEVVERSHRQQILTQTNSVTESLRLLDRNEQKPNTVDLFGVEQKKVAVPVPIAIKKRPIVKHKPTAPRIPFKYIGQLEEQGVIKIFLMEDTSLHIVRNGQKIGKDYRLINITKEAISLRYLPLNMTQKLELSL